MPPTLKARVGLVALSAALALSTAAVAVAAGPATTIDLRARRATHPTHAVVFMSRSGLPGHAFVLFTEESEERQMTLAAAYGFYPRSPKGVVAPVPGELANEMLRGSYSKGQAMLIVHLDAADYERLVKHRRTWETRQYHMRINDCISFVQDVAGTVGRLTVPRRGSLELPVDYVRRLAEANAKKFP